MLQLFGDVRGLLKDLFPVEFPDKIAARLCHRHVDESRALVEGHPESADDARVLVLHAKLPLLVDLVPYVDEARLYKQNLAELVKLAGYLRSLLVNDWLQVLKNQNHEVSVVAVVPSVKVSNPERAFFAD